jgi:hypothetical protein
MVTMPCFGGPALDRLYVTSLAQDGQASAGLFCGVLHANPDASPDARPDDTSGAAAIRPPLRGLAARRLRFAPL